MPSYGSATISTSDNGPTAPPPSTPSPSSLSDRFWVLDWNCDGHLARDDIIMSLVNIAVYPTPEDLDELMNSLGDGSPAAFAQMLACDPLPRILRSNEKIWDDLAVMRDRRRNVLGRETDIGSSFMHNVFWMTLVTLGFPLNLFFARAWARRVGMHDQYWAFYKKYPQLSYVCRYACARASQIYRNTHAKPQFLGGPDDQLACYLAWTGGARPDCAHLRRSRAHHVRFDRTSHSTSHTTFATSS